ncbi:MAG: hypothetical protein M1816_007236 [Peltula sp. TS41687]|nr:MAG: hypothetical protein M1816_007236 [Peltula sp. TS41687]
MTVHAAPERHHDVRLSRRQNKVPPDPPPHNEDAPEDRNWQIEKQNYPKDFWRESRYGPHPDDPEYPFEDPPQKCPTRLQQKANIYDRCIDVEWRTYIVLCRSRLYSWKYPAIIELRDKSIEQMHWEKAQEITAECRRRHRLTTVHWEVFLKRARQPPGMGREKNPRKVVPSEEDKNSGRNNENVKGLWDQAVQYGQGIANKLIPPSVRPPQNGEKSPTKPAGGVFFPAAAGLPVFAFP